MKMKKKIDYKVFWYLSIGFILLLAGYSLGYKVAKLECLIKMVKIQGSCY